MIKQIQLSGYRIKFLAEKLLLKIRSIIQKYWFKTVLALIVLLAIDKKDLNINVQLNAISSIGRLNQEMLSSEDSRELAKPINTSLDRQYGNSGEQKNTAPGLLSNGEKQPVNSSKGTFSVKKYGIKKLSKEEVKKRNKQIEYVKRFAKVAKIEMEKFGIPASITLAQGLLESHYGESKLAVRNKNHFGIKCFSRTCKKGHCSNFTDDSHKDFFRTYHNAWESYRSHSHLLKRSKRYRFLFHLKKTDYKGWAKGLKKAGYATDKKYAEKLIGYIEDMELYKYDK